MDDEDPGAGELARTTYALRDPRRPNVDTGRFYGALGRARNERRREQATAGPTGYVEPAPENMGGALATGAENVAGLPRRLQELVSDLPQAAEHALPTAVEQFSPQLAHEMLTRQRAARERGDWPSWFTYGVMAAPAAAADVANVAGVGGGAARLLGGTAREAVPAITGALQQLLGNRRVGATLGAAGASAGGAALAGEGER